MGRVYPKWGPAAGRVKSMGRVESTASTGPVRPRPPARAPEVQNQVSVEIASRAEAEPRPRPLAGAGALGAQPQPSAPAWGPAPTPPGPRHPQRLTAAHRCFRLRHCRPRHCRPATPPSSHPPPPGTRAGGCRGSEDRQGTGERGGAGLGRPACHRGGAGARGFPHRPPGAGRDARPLADGPGGRTDGVAGSWGAAGRGEDGAGQGETHRPRPPRLGRAWRGSHAPGRSASARPRPGAREAAGRPERGL